MCWLDSAGGASELKPPAPEEPAARVGRGRVDREAQALTTYVDTILSEKV